MDTISMRKSIYVTIFFVFPMTIGSTTFALANEKLKVDAQAGYLAAKACQKKVGGFNEELRILRNRRKIAGKKYPPLLPEGNRGGTAGLVLFYARSNYMRFQHVPRSKWKDYCRRGLGKAIRRTRSLK